MFVPSLHRALSGETHPSAPPPSPSMVPWKMTYASTDLAAAANFVDAARPTSRRQVALRPLRHHPLGPVPALVRRVADALCPQLP